MKTRSRRSALALLAGAALFSTGAAAMSPDGHLITRSETVKFDPEQVATPEGAAALYGALKKAAARVCVDPFTGSLRSAAEAAGRVSCARDALDKAVRQVGLSVITALHTSGSGRPAVEMASR